MGVYGALIVKKKDEVEAAEHVVMIQDYNNRFTFLDLHTQGLYGIFYPGGANFFPVRQIDGTISSVMEMTSSLINGRGRIMNGANDVTLTPLTVFTVVTGTVYRLRIINTATILQYVFSIDGHKLTVLSVDGNDVKPFETDRVVLHTGERCDVTIQANQPVKNYWVRAETLRIERQNHVYAILRYSGANIEDPTTVPTTCTIENPCTVFNCPFLTFPGWSCKSMDSVETPSADPVPTADDGPFKEFFVNTGFMFYGGKMVGQMNGVNNIMPKVSALTQPNDVTGTCDQFSDCGAEKMCTCTHVISVNMGDVVQLNFLNNGLFAIAHHSVHTHGYIFRLLKIGNRLSNASWTSPNDVNLGDNEDVDCRSAQRATAVCNNATWANPSWRNGNIPGIKMDHAVWKDTVTVPAGGYAVIRFKADNHGLWMVHCHMELHSTAMGLVALFK
ncbi:uncharacterized protein LOC127856351 [Dreissena polymorpha]|uniref:Laccase n=2 Tax=Dreissena polymorpha TaxID=45954 RepID=A0A9D4RFE1_DREPO|nr:uncharacterized protein LOC127856351 [Dreissena polymorpha]KAH3864587.1 hypothetical protein DPMN_027606 [Dreissena polymorpha]KAH3891221.1 hypothetical protein DPMN_015311 [Dreissena polymorpha]